MIVEPKVRGFICTTAHPAGCEESVLRQINYVKQHGMKEGPKRILIIGSSTGYGLASRIATTYTYGADTLGIMFEKEAKEKRTATPGYYNTKAFETQATKDGYYAKTINGDAFSEEIKKKTIEMIQKDLGSVDMVIYSLAAPRRTTAEGDTYSSVLKPIKKPFTNMTLDLRTNELSEITVPTATEQEVEATIKVMGGEDWELWMQALKDANVLSEGVITIAYSYIGPSLTSAIYSDGSIGMAKQHLYHTSLKLNEKLHDIHGKALISVNKALVTQASAAIPVVPLYISLLYKVMKEMGLHEGCIEQMDRLYSERLTQSDLPTDELGQIRMDDYELSQDVQAKVSRAWNEVNADNLKEYADIEGYWEEFYHMFGFHYDDIDYTKDIEI
ncbi:MAG: trans-2-enoyl-CoA reductase family protein [Fibrobacter sp.]|nr:trans-2-enoyl-CoA reductase family protein [Fibrobacter sp.]